MDTPRYTLDLRYWYQWKCTGPGQRNSTSLVFIVCMVLEIQLMVPSCSQNDPRRTPQTMEERRKHRTEFDRVYRTAETAEQKEHRVTKLRTKDGARRAGHADAE